MAKQYKYVVEEITVENKEETREDELGVKYRKGLNKIYFFSLYLHFIVRQYKICCGLGNAPKGIF